MSSTLVIVIAAIIVILALALVAGLVVARKRKISLREDRERAVETPRRGSGGYTATSGFNLASGGGTEAPPKPGQPPATPQAPPSPEAPAEQPAPEHPVADRPETEGQPGVGDDASVPRDSERRGIVDVGLPDQPGPETAPGETAPAEDEAAAPADEMAAADTAPAETADTETPTDTETEQTTAGPTEPGGDAAGPSAAEPEAGSVTDPGTAAAATPTAGPTDTTEPASAPTDTTGPADTTAATDTAGPRTTEPAAAATAPTAEPTRGSTGEPTEEIAPSEGRLERLRGRLSRSQNALGQGLLGLLGAGDLDEDSWTDIEDTLLMADLGSATTMEIVEQLRAKLSARGVRTAAEARDALHEVLVNALDPHADRAVRALPHPGGPGVVLVAGVNGTGKTTTTGKLARVLIAQGRQVLLGAADTFRAAAADQLETWGNRVGAETVRGKEGADPAAVAFDAVHRGGESGVDTVLIDTAGRLHTKTGLMDELGKVKRVVEKQAKVDEVLLVLDATTGQNGLAQARVFAEVVDITGIVLTKLDGTAKGGIVFQVQRELGVPVKLVGLGEGPDDLAPFEPKAFVDALLAE